MHVDHIGVVSVNISLDDEIPGDVNNANQKNSLEQLLKENVFLAFEGPADNGFDVAVCRLLMLFVHHLVHLINNDIAVKDCWF